MNPQELKKRIRGPVHLSMTPFDENEALDEKALRHNVRHAVENMQGEGVFLVNGSTGEFYAMNDDECRRTTEIVIEEVNGRLPVIVGTARAGTRYTIEMSKHAEAAGADGIMVVSPYYHICSGEELCRHFEQIAASIDIGIMVYNNPTTSKLWIPPALMARLSKVDNIIANKENTTNALAFYAMQKALDPEDMIMVCGPGQMLFPFEVIFDCPAFVTELCNFAPEIPLKFSQAAEAKDFEELRRLMDMTAPYHELISKLGQEKGPCPHVLSDYVASNDTFTYQAVCKEAMNAIGLPGGRMRSPMCNLNEADKEQVKDVLKNWGVL